MEKAMTTTELIISFALIGLLFLLAAHIEYLSLQ